jgi:phage shock protein A
MSAPLPRPNLAPESVEAWLEDNDVAAYALGNRATRRFAEALATTRRENLALARSLANAEITAEHRAIRLIDAALRADDAGNVEGGADPDLGYAVGRIQTMRARLAAVERERDEARKEAAELRARIAFLEGKVAGMETGAAFKRLGGTIPGEGEVEDV